MVSLNLATREIETDETFECLLHEQMTRKIRSKREINSHCLEMFKMHILNPFQGYEAVFNISEFLHILTRPRFGIYRQWDCNGVCKTRYGKKNISIS